MPLTLEAFFPWAGYVAVSSSRRIAKPEDYVHSTQYRVTYCDSSSLDLFTNGPSISEQTGKLFAYGLAGDSFVYGRSVSEHPLSSMLPRP